MNSFDFTADKDHQLLSLLEYDHKNTKVLTEILFCGENELPAKLVLVDGIKYGMLESTMTEKVMKCALGKLYHKLTVIENWDALNNRETILRIMKLAKNIKKNADYQAGMLKLIVGKVKNVQPLIEVLQQLFVDEHRLVTTLPQASDLICEQLKAYFKQLKEGPKGEQSEQKYLFLEMGETQKRQLMIRVVRIYVHTFLTDPLTEIIPQGDFDQLLGKIGEENQAMVVSQLLTINNKKVEVIAKKLLDFTIQKQEAGLVLAHSQPIINRTLISSSLFNEILRVGSGGYDFLKIEQINEELKVLTFRYNILQFHPDIFANILPYQIMQRDEYYKEQIERFSYLHTTLVSIIKKCADGWSFACYNYHSSSVVYEQYSGQKNMQIVDRMLLIWQNICKVAGTFDNFSAYDQQFGTFTRFYKREQFQNSSLMQLFTTLLNLEEVPKLNVVNSICYFLLYLSKIVSSEKFNPILKNKDFITLLFKKIDASIQKNIKDSVPPPFPILQLLLRYNETFSNLGLKVESNPLNRPHVFQFVVQEVFHHDHYQYSYLRGPCFYNVGEYQDQRPYPLLYDFLQLFDNFVDFIYQKLGDEIDSTNKKVGSVNARNDIDMICTIRGILEKDTCKQNEVINTKIRELCNSRPDLVGQLSTNSLHLIMNKTKNSKPYSEQQAIEELLVLVQKTEWESLAPKILVEDIWTDNPLLLELYQKLYFWTIAMEVNNRLFCEAEKYQELIDALKKIEFDLKQRMIEYLSQQQQGYLQKLISVNGFISTNLYNYFFSNPLEIAFDKFLRTIMYSGRELICNFSMTGRNFITQITLNYNKETTDHFDDHRVRSYCRFMSKFLTHSNTQISPYLVLFYQTFRKELFGPIMFLYNKYSKQEAASIWGWDINNPDFETSLPQLVLTAKTENNNPVEQYHKSLKKYPRYILGQLLEQMFNITTDVERIYVNDREYRGAKYIPRVQKNVLMDILTHFENTFDVQHTKFYLQVVRHVSSNIQNLQKYLEKDVENEELVINVAVAERMEICLGDQVDKLCSEGLIRLFNRVVVNRGNEAQKDNLKQLADKLLQSVSDKSILQKHKQVLLTQSLKRIEEYAALQQPRLDLLKVELYWVNLFLMHMQKGSLRKYFTPSFIHIYTQFVKYLISKGSDNSEDLSLTLPLLQRIVPILSQNDSAEVTSFALYMIKIVARVAEMQSFDDDNTYYSLISKLMRSNNEEITQYTNYFISKRNEQSLSNILCDSIATNDLQFMIEADIKGHFLKQMIQKNYEQSQIETELDELIFQYQQKYKKQIKQFRDKLFKYAKKKITNQSADNPKFVYQNKDSFSYSRVKNIEFVDYKPWVFMRSQVSKLIDRIVSSWEEGKTSLEYLKILIIAHPFMMPYILFHRVKVQNCKTFLQFMIRTAAEKCLGSTEARVFIIVCCLDYNSIVRGKSGPIMLSHYIISVLVRQLVKGQLTADCLALILSLCQLKIFTLFANMKIQQTQPSLRQKIQRFMVSSCRGFQYEKDYNVVCYIILAHLYRYDAVAKLADKVEVSGLKIKGSYRLIMDCHVPFDGVQLRRTNKRFKYDNYAAAFALLSQFEGIPSIVNEIKGRSEAFTFTDLDITSIKLQDSFQIKQEMLGQVGNFCEIRDQQRFYDYIEANNNYEFQRLYSMVQKFYTEVEGRATSDWQGYKLFKQRPDPDSDTESSGQNEEDQTVYSPTRFAAEDYTPAGESNEEEVDQQDEEQRTSEKFKKYFRQYKAEQIQSVENKEERTNQTRIQLTAQMLEIIAEIKNNLSIFKKQEFNEAELENKTAEQVLQYLHIRKIQTEFDAKEHTMNQHDFEAYCLANVNRLEKMTGERRDKVKVMEEYMLMRYIRRTSSSDSIDYIIDTIDQNYQLLNKIDRKMTVRQEDFQQKKPQQVKKRQSIKASQIDQDYFTEISEQVLFSVVMAFYNHTFVTEPASFIPFLQNSKAQAKFANTLLFVYKNPFDNKVFPKQIKHYGQKTKKEVTDEVTFFRNRILQFFCAFSEYAFYEDPAFLVEQIPLDCIKGIKLQPNPLFKDFFTADRYIPKIQILYEVFNQKDSKISKSNKIQLLGGVTKIPDILVDKVLSLLIELHDEFQQHTGQQQTNEANKFYLFQRYQAQKWHENLKNVLLNKLLIETIRQKYPIGEQLTWNPFMFCLFVETEVYTIDELKRAYEIVLRRKIANSCAIYYCTCGLKLYTDEELLSNPVLKQCKEYISMCFAIYIEKTDISLRKLKADSIYRLSKFPSLMTLQMKAAIFKLEIEQARNKINYDRDEQIFAKRKKGIFQSAFEDLRYKSDNFWKHSFDVKFVNEDGRKQSGYGGGVGKEWYTLVTKGMVNLNYGLFIKTCKNYYYFNRQSWINPRHLQFFEFIGKLFALSLLFPKYFVSPSFSILIYKMILHQKIDMQDIIDEFDEGEVVVNLQKMREYTDNSLFCQTFVYTDKRLVADKRETIKNTEGQGSIYLLNETQFIESQEQKEEQSHAKALKVIKIGESIELIPGGSNIPVTMQNLEEFIRLTKQKIYEIIVKSVQKQFAAFIEGFKRVIDLKYARMFTASELRQLAEGSDKIDIKQLKDSVKIQVSQCSRCLQLFWEVMEELGGEQRIYFMHHWTGIPKVPADGLKKMNLQIRERSDQKRIFAHTCFNRIYLPNFKTKEEVREAVLMAIATVKEGISVIED